MTKYGAARLDKRRSALHMILSTRGRSGTLGTGAYESVTRGIKVVVNPFYLDDQSEPDENHYVWAYHVEIVKDGHERVQLRTRYWRITDALGQVQEVRGPGVVGEQPVLDPGEAFEYTSGTPLPTPSGIMAGSYQMEGNNGEQFDVEIPAFSLDSPHQAVNLN